MPSRDDFAAARQAAFDCENASVWLLNIARKPVPEGNKAEWFARHLDQLARALVGASDAISRVENDLIRAALATGPVKAEGMTCSTAHRLALDLAGYLEELIRRIEPALVPLRPSGLTRSSVDVELVRKHLPAIVAKLAARPPFEVDHVVSLIEHEWARATERLDSARIEPARPTEAQTPRPPADELSGTEAASVSPARRSCEPSMSDPRNDETHLVGVRIFAPANLAALEALVSELEAAASRFSDYIADAETYYRALNRLQHPHCPDEARARLQAEVERLRPIVERRPTLSLSIQSCLSDIGLLKLKMNESLISKKDVLAELLVLYRDASKALNEILLQGPAARSVPPAALPAAPSPSGTTAPTDPTAGTPARGRAEPAPSRFARLDGGLEPFNPAACIVYPVEDMQGGPKLAYLELRDGRVVEQRGYLADGWTTSYFRPLGGWGEGREIRSRASDVYHAEYREVDIATAERECAARGLRFRAPAARPSDGPLSGGTDRPAARPEADADHQAPPPEGEPAAAGPDGSPRADRQVLEVDASGTKDSPSIDYEDLATKLRKQGKGTQAALVEYMADKVKATAEAIARHVHDDPEASDRAMWNNAKRTSDSLAALGAPLSFWFASGWMFREISPE